MKAKRRLTEHVISDPFIDLAFVYYLIKDSGTVRMLRRQAEAFTATGDVGYDTQAYRAYEAEVRLHVIRTFKGVYETIEKDLDEDVAKAKAQRAWSAIVAWYAYRHLVERIGLGVGVLLPDVDLADADVVRSMGKAVEMKVLRKGVRGPEIVKKIMREVGVDKMPVLWWINLAMEREIFEAVLKYHYLVYSKMPKIELFVREVEEALQVFRNHKTDFTYALEEVLKGLLSRCVEARGQYINKLHNAIVLVKVARRSIKEGDLGRWEWFLHGGEILTYAASIYMVELQKSMASIEGRGDGMIADLAALIGPRKGEYAGYASALASLIALSPIFMQYAVEARRTFTVTPADILVAVLKLIEKRGLEDFTISVQSAGEEIVEFWRSSGILSRLQRYCKCEITPDAIYKAESFTTSLALLIYAGALGLHAAALGEPILRLPPKMIGYDSLYIRPRLVLPIVKKIWEV